MSTVVLKEPSRSDEHGGHAVNSEMSTLIHSFDWSKTRLGPMERWPTSLRTMVGVALRSRFPMALWWGHDLVSFYNDAYRPILGDKHPASLGRSGREVWAEIWPIVGPQAEGVLTDGPATWNEHLLLPMNRRGYVEETYFTFSYSPIPDDDGRVGGVLITCTETTEQVQDERQLRTLRDLAARAGGAVSVVVACETAMRILSENDADAPFAAVYLLDEQGDTAHPVERYGTRDAGQGETGPVSLLAPSAHGWPLFEALHANEPLVLDDLLARVGAVSGGRWGEPPRRGIVVPISRPGHPQPYGFLACAVSPVRALDDRYAGFFRLVADQIGAAITNALAHEEERRRAEALAAVDRAKTEFFSNVSHEFRTPLTLMIGPTEDALATGELRGEELHTVYRNELRLLKLVNSLLEFARIEANRADASYEATDLAAVTVDLASAFRSAIERGGLAFVIDCAPLAGPVYVDREMWEKIVLNLLSNALKFTFEGSIEVSLRQTGHHVELKVSDTGVGIAESALPHVFERFYRVQGERARTHEGSGIGLALVQGLARLHGGGVSVTSRVGQGTTFTVSIPMGADHLPAQRIKAPKELASTSTGARPYVVEALRWLPDDAELSLGSVDTTASPSGACVLLADDNADMRDYLRRILESRWRVRTVADGVEALEAMREDPPDLVLTDVMMPRLDGFGLLRAMRADSRLNHIPLVILSARAGEEARVEGLEAGADEYIVKPFSARELLTRVGTQLALAQARKLAEVEREKLAHIFEDLPVALVILEGPEHNVVLSNRSARRLFADRRDWVGKRLLDVRPELSNQNVTAMIEQVFTTGEARSTKEMLVKLDSGDGRLEDRWYDAIFQPTLDTAGRVTGVLACGFEITESVVARTALEQARADAETASRAKDEFLAMLGHELRNPLAPILTALQLMQLRGNDVFEKERQIIDRQVRHVVRLVDDLLDVSRITRGKVSLARAPTEIASVVANGIEIASPLLEQRSHHLKVEVPSGLIVHGDAVRLGQVLANLLTNAAKYTPAGGHIDVVADRQGEYARIRVKDTGIGIRREMLPSVFDHFVQERQALDRSQGGLGLGLAIVRALVEMHGGSVVAASEGPGRGSEFTIRLPISEEKVELPSQVADRKRQPAKGGRRILVVDDNEDAADSLAEVLGELGHCVEAAHDGAEALAKLETFVPEVAFLDIGLPVMDGYELARRIREIPRMSGVRLIAVTGYGQSTDRLYSREAGFTMHLVKPVNLSVIERALSGDAFTEEH